MAKTGIVFLASAEGNGDDASSGRRAYRLESLFRELNGELSHRLEAGFQLRKGTREFGAILTGGPGAGAVLMRLWTELHPLKMRVAFVPGRVRVQTDLWTGGGTQGPASLHHFAGPPLDRAESLLEELMSSRSLVAVDLRDGTSARRLRHLGTLLQLRLVEWTPRQLETYLTYSRLGSQSRTAQKLGVTQPTVSETLSRIEAPATTEALEFFTDELDGALAEAAARIGEDAKK